jgi:hypothetical protein
VSVLVHYQPLAQVVLGGFRRRDPAITLRHVWVLHIERREWRRHDVPLHPSALANVPTEQATQMLDHRVAFQGAALGAEQIYLFGGMPAVLAQERRGP